MPIVHVELYPGRDQVIKEFLARRIVDRVAEIAGCYARGGYGDLSYRLLDEHP